MSEYKYANEPLSIIAAIDNLKSRFTINDAIKRGHSLKALMSVTEKKHTEKGGLPTKDADSLVDIIRWTLHYLRDSGHANELLGGNWRLSKNDQRIFGGGQHWVYLYYFEEDKDNAESQEKKRWRCRIGKAKKDPEGRITRPTTGAPIPPIVGLLFRTDKHTELEGAIHRTLKLRGQHLEKLQGEEWFNTNPDEVLEIYDFIIHNKPNYTKITEKWHIGRAERIRKRMLESESID